MKAVLYICHGSRVKEANEQAVSFIQQIMSKIDASIQEISFLEISEPTIAKAFESCVNQGATKIVVIPILLLTAGHAKKDIPRELAMQKKRYPHVKVEYGHPIGVHHKMSELLLERIVNSNIPIHDDTLVLLVGRGSKDPDVKRDLTRIGVILAQRCPMIHVEVCFLTEAEPNIKQQLDRSKESKYQRVLVIPYLFFSGVLMNKINNIIMEKKAAQGPEITLGHSLGYHPIIEDIFNEQIIELLDN